MMFCHLVWVVPAFVVASIHESIKILFHFGLMNRRVVSGTPFRLRAQIRCPVMKLIFQVKLLNRCVVREEICSLLASYDTRKLLGLSPRNIPCV